MLRITVSMWIKRFFSVVIFLSCFFIIFVHPAFCANIVVDHTNWDWYKSQPQTVVDRVAPLKIFFAHASVGGNVMEGLLNLHSVNSSRYPLTHEAVGGTPGTTSKGTIYDYSRGNPGWAEKISSFEQYIANGWHATTVDIVMNKFCYIDQNADWTSYRDSMLALEAAYPTTRFIYWTMPIQTSSGYSDVLRAKFNQNLRDWIATQNNKILFDIADIEAWSPAGVHQTFSYGEQIYEKMYSGYTSDGGHLNSTGSERVATGLYSLFGLLTGSGTTLFGYFPGNSIWQWNGSVWSLLTPDTPEAMAASGSNFYGDFGNSGIWHWNSSIWSLLTPDDPEAMAASGSNLYGDFGSNGLWQWNGSGWSQLTPDNPAMMVATNTKLYASFTGSGIWEWNGTGWSQLTADNPSIIAANGTCLYGSFAGDGLWQWNGTGWNLLTPDNPEAMVASDSNFYGTFAENGVWEWNGTSWSQLTVDNPLIMAASGTHLYGSFGTNGIWQWNGSSWSQLTPDNPSGMVAGN